MASLFESLDYRHFLKQHFDEVRKEKNWFSYRMIANKLKIDAGQLVKILQGQRHISERLIPAFSKFLGLEKKEQEYFTCLVRFNKAKTGSDTELYFEKLMEIKDLTLPQVEPDQDKFYQKWYHSVIRVLFAFYKFDGDFKKLGSLLSPAISAKEAQESVALLLELGLIEKKSDGSMSISDRFITGGGNWRMLAVRHFQRQTIQLSERSLMNDPPAMRDISSLTISIPEERLGEFRAMIAEFRKSILRQVMEIKQEPDRVYQLNLQLIPVAVVGKTGSGGESQ
jgi:uncharacterized protein (TIGR02147 family)